MINNIIINIYSTSCIDIQIYSLRIIQRCVQNLLAYLRAFGNGHTQNGISKNYITMT